MSKYEYVTTSKIYNYMTPATHIEATSTKINKKPTPETDQNTTPTRTANDSIATNQNSKPISIKPKTDVEGLHEAYHRPTSLYIHGIHCI